MFESYRQIFSHPGALAFSMTGLLARLPLSMMSLGIIFMVDAHYGSYADAGKVAAAYVIGNAAFALLQGRFTDRFGQSLILYIDTVVFGLTTAMLVYATTAQWAFGWLLMWAFLAGASLPQVGSMIRARWIALVNTVSQRDTAFAVEAIADELVFVTGPTLVTFAATLIAPPAGVLTALAFGTVGTLLLALQHRTSPPAQPSTGIASVAPMPWRRLVVVGLASLCMGALFGAVDVTTVAVAEFAGVPVAAGLLLTTFSIGSLLSGVIAGTIQWRSSDLVRFRRGLGTLSLGMIALPLISNLWLLAAVMFLIGFALAPTLIALAGHIETITPTARLTEAMAVFQTGVAAGLAPGMWLAGILADTYGSSAGYWLCVAFGVLGLGFGMLDRTTPTHGGDSTDRPHPEASR